MNRTIEGEKRRYEELTFQSVEDSLFNRYGGCVIKKSTIKYISDDIKTHLLSIVPKEKKCICKSEYPESGKLKFFTNEWHKEIGFNQCVAEINKRINEM